jgi:hypothetical protein
MSQHLAEISFLILYPLFFFYNAAIAFGYISPALGGLYGPYSLMVTSLYAIMLLPLARDIRSPAIWINKLFIIFIGWILFWTFLNYAFNTDHYVDAASTNLMGFLIQLITNFLIGYYLTLSASNAKWFTSVVFVLWLCMFVFVLKTFDVETLSVHGALYWGEDKGLADPESFASYQGFARSSLLTSFILVAMTKHFVRRLLIEAISVITLFLLSARSEIVGFLSAVALFEILISVKRPSRFAGLAVFGFFMTISIVYFSDSTMPDLSGSRITLLEDLDRDNSWQLRRQFSHRAFEQIMDNPLFGKFGGEYYEGLGQEGTYAHNILSAWVSLGLPGFSLYLSLLVGSFLVSMKRTFDTRGLSNLWNLAMLTSVSALMLSLSAKDVYESWFGLVFGLVLNVSKAELQSSPKRGSPGLLSLRSAEL